MIFLLIVGIILVGISIILELSWITLLLWTCRLFIAIEVLLILFFSDIPLIKIFSVAKLK